MIPPATYATPASSPGPPRRGVVAVISDEAKLLVIRRSSSVVAPLAYCFPGGGVEPGESQRQALIREVREELGVEVEPRERIWDSETAWGVRLAWWRATLAAGSRFAANPAEVASVHWFSPQELAALDGLLDSNRAFLAALASGKVTV